jgi:lipopolysaccharide/colanic/teichoic acid biosynthesis glycosyltransferase
MRSVGDQGFFSNLFERVNLGRAAVGGLMGLLAIALAVGTDFGLVGIIAIIVGLATLLFAGTWLQIKQRDALYEHVFTWRGLGANAHPIEHFGVRDWSGWPGESQPPYVERDIAPQVMERLTQNQLVLLTGPRTTGKSRFIYEVAKRRTETILVVGPVTPHAEDSFRTVMKERHGLSRWEGGKVLFVRDFAARVIRRDLTADSLRSLLERNRNLSIIATLSPEDIAGIEGEGEEAERSLREIEELASGFEFPGELQGEELERAQRQYPNLEREQLVRLPRYMIADHPLRERLDQGADDGLGKQLVLAAAAWRQIGLARPAPRRYLRSVLSKGEAIPDEEFEQALEWALEPARGEARLLYPSKGDEGEGETHFEVDPVVMDLLDEGSDRDRLPDSTWDSIYQEIVQRLSKGREDAVAAELIALGEAALASGRWEFGRKLLREARQLGNSAQEERCARALTSGTRIGSVTRALVASRRGDSIAQRLLAVQSRAEERQRVLLRDPEPDGPGRFIAEIYAHRIVRAVLRMAALVLADLLSAFAGLGAGLATRTLILESAPGFDEVTSIFLNVLPAWGAATIFLFALVRLYKQDAPRARFGAILQATGTLGVIGLVAAVATDFHFHVALLLSALVGTLVASLLDYLLRSAYDVISSGWVKSHSLAARTLLIGRPDQVATIEESVEAGVSRPMRICGYLSTSGESLGEPDATGRTPLAKYSGTLEDFARILVDKNVGRVLIVDWDMSRAKRQAVADRCHLKSLPVEAVPSFADIRAGTPAFIPGQSLALIPMLPLWQSNVGFTAKRIFDVVGAVLGIILLSPILILIGLVVGLSHWQFPVRVTALRHGAGREVFGMYRFRTAMDPPRNRDLPALNGEEDNVTWIGKWLRKHRLDELPQLLNVLRGHMSLVGPRPLRMDDDAALSENDLLRYVVRPGATGPWQISGRKEMPPAELTSLDMAYLRNWSIAADIEILVKTVRVVLLGGGRQTLAYDQAPQKKEDLAEFG